MTMKKTIYALCDISFIALLIIVLASGCKGVDQQFSTPTYEQQSEQSAAETLKSMLGIALPDSAKISLFISGSEEIIESVKIPYFCLSVAISSTDIQDFEQQIRIFFGEPKSDFENGVISEETTIVNPAINLNSNGLVLDRDRIERIYFRFGTGAPLLQAEKPFITRYVCAFVMQEEDGSRVVHFSYGA